MPKIMASLVICIFSGSFWGSVDIQTSTRTPAPVAAIHHQLISLIKRQEGTMVHPWPHHDAQDSQGLAKGDAKGFFFFGKPDAAGAKAERVVSCFHFPSNLVGYLMVWEHLTELMYHLSNLLSCVKRGLG